MTFPIPGDTPEANIWLRAYLYALDHGPVVKALHDANQAVEQFQARWPTDRHKDERREQLNALLRGNPLA